jgi:hypothetical protein
VMNEGKRGSKKHSKARTRPSCEVGGCCDSDESLNDSIVSAREMLLDKSEKSSRRRGRRCWAL